jgi:CubicO group peptidase (beta-lactamase class C family)
MQLVETGKVNIDHPYLEYVPYFKMADSRYVDITIRHLLGNNAGMPEATSEEWFEFYLHPSYGPDASKQLVESLANVKLNQDPGGPAFIYSDIGFDVLAELVRLVSGELFEDYVRRHILEPLQMKDSTMLYSQVDKRTLSAPHIYDSARNIVVWDHFPGTASTRPALACSPTSWISANGC